MNILDPFSVMAESGLLFIFIPFSSTLKMFPGVSERLFSFAALSSVLKYFYSLPLLSLSCS